MANPSYTELHKESLDFDATDTSGDISLGDDTLERAREKLAKLPAAVSGQGGHNALRTAVLAVVRTGLGADEAFKLVMGDYNTRCVPPRDEREVRDLCSWAARNVLDDHTASPTTSARPTKGPVGLDADTLDAAYRALLDNLRLTAEDRESFRKRGMNNEEIDIAAYRSAESSVERRHRAIDAMKAAVGEDRLVQVPGVISTEFGPELNMPSGILVPVRDMQGRVVGLRVRVVRKLMNKKRVPILGPDGKPVVKKSYLWVSGRPDSEADARSGAPAHVPIRKNVTDLTMVRVTEGEIKADLATWRSGILTLSVPGVGNWRPLLPVLASLGAKQVLIAYDADAAGTGVELVKLADALIAAGCGVAIERWPLEAGKGIDDVLVAGRGADIWRVEGEDVEHHLTAIAAQFKMARRSAPSVTDLIEEIEVANDDEPTSDVAGAPASTVEPQAAAPRAVTNVKANTKRGRSRTDLGNAERLVDRHGGELRYIPKWGKWLHWDGRRWIEDGTCEVHRRAQETVRSIYEEAKRETDVDLRKAIAVHAMRSEGSSRVAAMIHEAQARPGVAIDPAVFDADPWVLNVSNGVIDLRTGELLAHDRSRMITKLAPVAYDANAPCPRWERFLEEAQPNPDVRAFLQRHVGYSLTGAIREHAFIVHYGKGRNGKGTFINALLHALGDYACDLPAESLMARRGEAHPTDKTILHGKRFASASETKENCSLDIPLVKRLTGGDPITARRMHEDFWTFLPTHKLVLLTNHKPVIRETKDAIWMRVHLVPWLAMFTGSRQDTSLGDTLKAEASGILAWAVRGCLEWQRIGLAPPEAVLAATQQYREDEDLLGAFLTDHCVLGEACTVGATDLFVAYKEWAEENNEPALTQKKFGTALKERGEGFTQERDSKTGRATWRGLRLSGEARAGAEESPLFWSSPVEDV